MSTATPPTYTPEEHLLLNRLRPNSTGMGYLSLEILANNQTWYDGVADWHDHVLVGEFEAEERPKLGKQDGIVNKAEEVEFLKKMNSYVDIFYEKTRGYGQRNVAQHYEYVAYNDNFMSSKCLRTAGLSPEGDASDDAKEVRDMIRKALLQYIILTTHFHDKTLATAQEEDVQKILALQTQAWKKEWASTWEYNEDDDFDRRCPPIVYDYNYANSLSIAELATIVSLASPLTPALYKNEEDSYKDDWGYFEYCSFLRSFLAHRCGLRPEDVTSEDGYESLEDLDDDEGAEEIKKAFYEAVDSGVWTSGYKNKIKLLEDLAWARGMDNWWKDVDSFTTTGSLEDGAVKKRFCLSKYPTDAEESHESMKKYMEEDHKEDYYAFGGYY